MPDLELRRYESYLFRDKSTSDAAQVPLASATVTVYHQGANTLSNVTVVNADTASVFVSHVERLQAGDVVHPNGDDQRALSVTSINASSGLVTFGNVTGEDIFVASGERLCVINRVPTLYRDPLREQAVGSNSLSVDVKGFVAFYCTAAFFDLALTGSGLNAPRLHVDERGGRLRGGETWRNALDHASIQAAIDSLPIEGGTVFIPAGTYTLTQTLYTPCDRPCHIVGEGSQLNSGPSTVLRWTINTGMVRMRGDHSSVRGVSLRMEASGSAASEDRGYGVFIGRRGITDAHAHPGTSTTATEHAKYGNAPLKGMLIEDVHIHDTPGWGLTIPGIGETSSLIGDPPVPEPEPGRVTTAGQETLSFWIDVRRVRVTRSRKYGALFTGGGCTTLFFDNCAFLNVGVEAPLPARFYAYLRKTVGAVFRNTTFEGPSPPGPTGEESFNPWIRIVGCQSITFETCWFENDPQPNVSGLAHYLPQYFLHLAATADVPANQSVHIIRPHMVRGGNNNGGLLKLVYCDSNGVQGFQIESPFVVSTTSVIASGAFLDQAPVVLNGESNTNANESVVVLGNGVIWDGALHPLLIATIPHKSTVVGRDVLKLPVSDFNEIKPSGSPGVEMLRQNGSTALIQLSLSGSAPAAAALMTYWGGRDSGWRLANACPVLTSSERDQRTDWVNGEMIINSSSARMELRYGGQWVMLKDLS